MFSSVSHALPVSAIVRAVAVDWVFMGYRHWVKPVSASIRVLMMTRHRVMLAIRGGLVVKGTRQITTHERKQEQTQNGILVNANWNQTEQVFDSLCSCIAIVRVW